MKTRPSFFSRRHVLRAAGGIAIALPFMRVAESRADAPQQPKRFVGMYHPNGIFPTGWWPLVGAGESDFTLASSHASLLPFREQLLITSGIDLKCAVTGAGEQHQRGLGGLLTGTKIMAGTFVGNDGTTAGWAAGASLDQDIAKLVGPGSRASSLQLGVKVGERDVSGVLSYAGSAQPLLPQTNPQQVFRTLFADAGAAPDEMDRIRARRASVLDTVMGQIGTLKKNVGKDDKLTLDAHLTLLRDIERRSAALPGGVVSCDKPSMPPSVAYDTESAMPSVSTLQLDLLALAFACDLTRVATVMFADAKDHIGMPFLDIRSDVHNVSHLGDTDPNRAKLGDRDAWVAKQLAYFLGRLREQKIGDQTLLDSTLVLWGSEVSMGNTHSHENMPFLLAGGGAGFRMGRYVRYAGASHNDLLTSIYRGFGSTATRYGDASFCNGPLANLV